MGNRRKKYTKERDAKGGREREGGGLNWGERVKNVEKTTPGEMCSKPSSNINEPAGSYDTKVYIIVCNLFVLLCALKRVLFELY